MPVHKTASYLFLQGDGFRWMLPCPVFLPRWIVTHSRGIDKQGIARTRLQIIEGQNNIDLDTTITMKAENITIADFIDYLNRQFQIQTGYFNEISAFNETICVNVQNQPLKTVLDTVFRPHNIQFIMISKKLMVN